MALTAPYLVADIGATNARFALAEPDGTVRRTRSLICADFAGLEQALEAYLADEPRLEPVPRAAAIAVASPVLGDRVSLTNNPWSFSTEQVRRHFGFAQLAIVNDFEANARAVPHLGAADRAKIGGGSAAPDGAVGVIGPGSGLGVSGLVRNADGWAVLSGEGGHVTMAAADARESAVLDLMRRRFDHVSAERVLSGPGLVNLYNALCEIDGVPAAPFTPAQITDPSIGVEHPRCRAATEMFCAMLGTVAGNLALTLGARAGIYIAGGIVPKLGPVFAGSEFRERFEAKGRFRGYLAAIPTYVITHPMPAFVGLAALLARADAPVTSPGA